MYVNKKYTKTKAVRYLSESHKRQRQRFWKIQPVYGWNGSGKSTLSGGRCIENKASSVKFPSSEFTIAVDGRTAITQANITKSDLNVCTFNQDFIDENISWNSVVKSILLVDVGFRMIK